MYKEASILKLRFETSKGCLSVEQLWDLNLFDLSAAIKKVKKVLKKSDDDELSFLDEAKTVDTENELRFNILKDVFLTKKKNTEDAMNERERKEFNQGILARIKAKQEQQLDELSIEDLEKMLK